MAARGAADRYPSMWGCASGATRSASKDSSASQVHATVVIASVLVAFVGLAIIARLALTGGRTVRGVRRSGATPVVTNGVEVTLTVTNKGSSAGQTTCRVNDPARSRRRGRSAFLLSSAHGARTDRHLHKGRDGPRERIRGTARRLVQGAVTLGRTRPASFLVFATELAGTSRRDPHRPVRAA